MGKTEKNTALKISSFIFAIVSILHLVRGVMDLRINIEHISVPIWVSFIFFVVAGFLAVWMYRLSRR